jgi:hypothetical protein
VVTARGRGILITAAATLVVAAVGCGDPSGDEPRPRPISGVQAELTDDVRPAKRGLVSWKSTWQLRWRRVPGARDYLVYTGTSEGDSPHPAVRRRPHYAIEVASGVNQRAQISDLRSQQVAFTAAQLTASVAARYPGGRIGPKAGPFAVGEPIP